MRSTHHPLSPIAIRHTLARQSFAALLIAALALCLFLLFAPPSRAHETNHGPDIGEASWYGHESGSHTATGARFDPGGMTAAHRTLPFGTKVRVTDIVSGKQVIVVINDRGPAKWTGRIIDLAEGAAAALGFKRRGHTQVRLEIVH